MIGYAIRAGGFAAFQWLCVGHAPHPMLQEVSRRRASRPFFFRWRDMYELAAEGHDVDELLAVSDAVWLCRCVSRAQALFICVYIPCPWPAVYDVVVMRTSCRDTPTPTQVKPPPIQPIACYIRVRRPSL